MRLTFKHLRRRLCDMTCIYFACGRCQSSSCILGHKAGDTCRKNGVIHYDPLEEVSDDLTFIPELVSEKTKTKEIEKRRKRNVN